MDSGDSVYQVRYGWSRGTWVLLAVGLALMSTVLVSFQDGHGLRGRHPAIVLEILCVPCGAFLLLVVLSALIVRPVAFRVDQSGVTLGGNPIPGRRRAGTRFIPWAQIEQVKIWRRDLVLFNLDHVGLAGRPAGPRVSEPGLTDDGDGLLAYTEPAGIIEGASRPVGMWRLDRNRLERAVATFAPDVTVVDELD